jgi:hypothetical protein
MAGSARVFVNLLVENANELASRSLLIYSTGLPKWGCEGDDPHNMARHLLQTTYCFVRWLKFAIVLDET